MVNVLAIIPARSGSKGIPGKNWKPFAGGGCLVHRAAIVSADAGHLPVISSDCEPPVYIQAQWLQRPLKLAQDDTPMIAVVQHVLEQIPGPPDQKILLLQPTQPLRQAKHLQQALALLTPEWDSVVSVVETVSPDELLEARGEELKMSHGWSLEFPSRRQVMEKGYKRDGTVYAFWRKTVACGDMYGSPARALIIDPSETCPLDTEADWREAERRLRERQA
jgi:CMP-N-acetylneuraminic acid synthetase